MRKLAASPSIWTMAWALAALLALGIGLGAQAQSTGDLFEGPDALEQNFRPPMGEWLTAGGVGLHPEDDARLAWTEGSGAVVNGESGRTVHLFTNEEHGDAVVELEFMVPEGSNSGVYLQGRYEIQILDSWGVEEPAHSDCGGLYQRWNNAPGIDDSERGFDGVPPRVNASFPPGQWQRFEIVFRAPRFDADGNKVRNAVFEKVLHNGVLIHENVEATGPTRAAAFDDEQPKGPVMLQGDHGPVAFRRMHIHHIKEN